jgi:hypothetical protein
VESFHRVVCVVFVLALICLLDLANDGEIWETTHRSFLLSAFSVSSIGRDKNFKSRNAFSLTLTLLLYREMKWLSRGFAFGEI